jgi:nucleotide-binding universal stress UspA family protein
MKLPTRILVPTDFSAHAEHALDYAIELAAKLGCEIHVLHVYEIPLLYVPDALPIMTPDMITAFEEASIAGITALVARKRSAKVMIKGHTKSGDVRTGIGTAVAELGADLVCMGTHGRRGLQRALLGSVAEFVVRTASVPVLTIGRHLS